MESHDCFPGREKCVIARDVSGESLQEMGSSDAFQDVGLMKVCCIFFVSDFHFIERTVNHSYFIERP